MAKENQMLFILAGEDSGDNYGAMLIREIKKKNPALSVKGIGGDRMKAAGVELIPTLADIIFPESGHLFKKVPLNPS